MAGDETRDEVVAIAMSPGQRSWTGAFPWLYLTALLVIFPVTRPVGAIVAILGVIAAVGSRRPRPLRLSPTGIEVRGLVSRRSVRWTDVAALTTATISSRRGMGLSVDVVPFGAAPRHPSMSVVLEPNAEATIRRYLADHHLDIPVDPTEPWQDRRGGWHAVELISDPHQTIRAIGRAWVGPWLICIDGGSAGRARATVLDRRTETTVKRAGWRESLGEATADAEDFIAAARREIGADGPSAP